MSRRTKLWISGLATLVLGVVLLVIDERMQEAGAGILDFELAGTEERADEIIRGWDAEAEDAAQLSLWLDFAYLAAYGAFLSLAARALSERLTGRLAAAGRFAATGAIVAAAADAIEDVALLIVLGGGGGSVAPAVAATFAIVKFALAAYAIAFILIALVVSRR